MFFREIFLETNENVSFISQLQKYLSKYYEVGYPFSKVINVNSKIIDFDQKTNIKSNHEENTCEDIECGARLGI